MKTNHAVVQKSEIKSGADLRQPSLWKRLVKQKELQLMVIPGILFLIVFKFLPSYGLLLAFKEFIPVQGVWASPWVGLKHFEELFTSSQFHTILYNTVMISLLKIVFTFPLPILFALLLNELRTQRFRSFVQGISYLPHFVSWVIVGGVMATLLAKDEGALNSLLLASGLISEPILFLGSPNLFWPLLIISENWKEMGWSAIIYVAAITGVDPELYEASKMDGANRLQQMWYVTLPCIIATIVIMFILRIGSILDAGFDQILVLRNPLVSDVANIIDTYVLDVGLKFGRFSFATAAGLFKSVIGFVLIILANRFAKRHSMGIW
ncbi:protein lplB [Paenibacillus swuensis]|uniref:Protein lplB n=1 Tax=Paenibacillus swuensis TaxID=1178515 RepID=A0A172TEP2_9BACL|nr:ABC transporter permease subunit [Paenibacillus swuensis]ANE45535.1 protein lplB [Paenibacillus swuensis]